MSTKTMTGMKTAVMMSTKTVKMMIMMLIAKINRAVEHVMKMRLTMTKMSMIKRMKKVVIILMSVVAIMLRFYEFYYYRN